MKAVIIYALLNTATGSLPHTPHACCGGSGKLYGHALFDPKYKTHVFRMDAATFEGGAGRDIANGGHRSFQKWEVRPEISVDLEDHEAQLTSDLERVNGELAQANQTIEVLREELSTLQEMIQKSSQAATPAVVDAPIIAAPEPVKTVTEANKHDWSYQELKDLAKERGIDLGANPSKAKLLEALIT